MELKLQVTGVAPLLMHNGRLSNPLDAYTRELATITSKRKKTDDDLLRIAEIEARASAYETEDGYLGMPRQNLWRSIYDASKAHKLGETVKRALIVTEAVTEPLTLDGSPVTVDDYLKDFGRSVFHVPVTVQRRRTMRARPIIKPPWCFTATMELLDDVLDPHMLRETFERAGRLVGLGDWRPTYGRYQLEIA